MTFLIYVCIKELRTVPGKITMNYIAALALAQLALQVNDDFVHYPYVCKAVATLQHYFWLASFTWTNAMAYRMYRSFKDGFLAMTYSQRLTYFAAYAWLSPCFIIIPCLTLDLLNKGWFQYGDEQSCWISQIQPYVLLYAFGCPILLLVSINILLLTTCARLLHVAFSQVRDVHYINKRQSLSIYARLFIFMGVNWLIGFLPSMTGIELFWYPFIILNTLQGFFIFMVFGVQKVFSGCKQPNNRELRENLKTNQNFNPAQTMVKPTAQQESVHI